MVVKLSAFRSALDRHPMPFEWPIDFFAAKLTTFRVRDLHVAEVVELVRSGEPLDGWLARRLEQLGGDRDRLVDEVPRQLKARLPAWSPAVYPAGATRAAANVLEVSCLVLDVDGGAPLDAVWALWRDHARLLHTSWSHSASKPKCRLVVPLAEPVPAAAWGRVFAWASLQARRGGVQPDQQCSDPSRLFFAPAIPHPDHPHEARVHLDAPLLTIDWRRLPDPAEARRAALRARPPIVLPPGRSAPRYQDAGSREDLAHQLGAQVAGVGVQRRADKIPCPSCGRPAVAFWFEPDRATAAWCSHRRSCGWTGPLHVLEAACRA